ncbi:MAG: helix-turn-helix transcriptional regulator [Bdellovibrionales bacterium]|jgi:transcriptional regulator with XRE-family HTH domain|nr:helix-turn-helix transcriptional regulator [Bdellovibrionales bacterium]
MIEVQSQRIKTALKTQLKKKQMTYEDLAKHLKVSVPTVKRYLGAEEITVGRLLEICELLDLSLEQLAKIAEIGENKDERFTEEQEKFFAKNPNYFAYFLKICEGLSPVQIAEKYGLNRRSTDKYLIGLENQGTVRVTGKTKVKSAFRDMPSFGRGVLAKAYFESFIQRYSKFFVEFIHAGLSASEREVSKKRESVRYSGQVLKMSKVSYQKWEKEIESLLKLMSEVASVEEKTLPEKELASSVFVVGHGFIESDNPFLKRLDTTFGEITNLP